MEPCSEFKHHMVQVLVQWSNMEEALNIFAQVRALLCLEKN